MYRPGASARHVTPSLCALGMFHSGSHVALEWHSTAPSFHPVSRLLSSRNLIAVPAPRVETRVVATSV